MTEVIIANYVAEEELWIRKLLRELKSIKNLTKKAELNCSITI